MSEAWTLNGQILVEHLLPELIEVFGARNGLGGITVKVSARSDTLAGWSRWNHWGNAKTDRKGRFQVSDVHGADRRQFKVEIRFDSDRLRIKEGRETSINLDCFGFPDVEFDPTDQDWHEVHNDSDGAAIDGRKAGVIELGSLSLTTSLARKHGDIWSLCNKVLDLFEGFGGAYAFHQKLVVQYPMGIGSNSANAASYANPITRCISIKEDEFHSRTMVQELARVWFEDHATDEDGMAWPLARHGSAHQTRENTAFVPGEEALTEWSAYQILKHITDGRLLNFKEDFATDDPDLSLNPAHAGGSPLWPGGPPSAAAPSASEFAKGALTEHGWHGPSNVLTIPYLDYDFDGPLSEQDNEYAFYSLFGTKWCPEARLGYSFKDVLSTFLKRPANGIDTYIKTDEMDFALLLS